MRIWDAQTGECLQVLEGHSKSIPVVAFSNDGTRVATVSLDETVRIWDPDTGECLWMQPIEAPYQVKFNDDGSSIINSDSEFALPQRARPLNPVDTTGIVRYRMEIEWLMNASGRSFWVPPSYRSARMATAASTVAFGLESGEVVIITDLDRNGL